MLILVSRPRDDVKAPNNMSSRQDRPDSGVGAGPSHLRMYRLKGWGILESLISDDLSLSQWLGRYPAYEVEVWETL